MLLSHILTLKCVLSIAVIAYHYVAYPLFLAVWASLKPHSSKATRFTPTISLIIAAYNEKDVIEEKIRNSLMLDYPDEKLEIIVITDGSTDSTPVLAGQFEAEAVLLLHEPERRGKSAALNRATLAAKGDILVFSDANAMYDEKALRFLSQHFADAKVGAVSGKKTIRASQSSLSESTGAYWRYESAIKTWESQIGSTVAVVGEMLAIRRQLFNPIPGNFINDDAYLATDLLRRGYRVLYEPQAICWETAPLSTSDEIIRRRRINAGRYQLLFEPRLWPWRYPVILLKLFSHKFLRLLLPIFMISALLANLLNFFTRRGRLQRLMDLTLLAQLTFYGLAFVGWLAEQKQVKIKLPALVFYIVSGNIATLQGLLRFLSGKQTVLWEKARRE